MAVLIAGCGGSDDPTGPAAATGVYTLAEINGEAPPTEAPEFTPQSPIHSGRLTLIQDGTFTLRLELDAVPPSMGTQFADALAGSWTQSGVVITIVPDPQNMPFQLTMEGGQLEGDFLGDTLTFTLEE